MNKFSRDLMQGMKEAAAFAEGKKAGARVHVVEVPSTVKASEGIVPIEFSEADDGPEFSSQ